jgi:hypothetical protein
LRSLAALEPPPAEVLAVDGGCTDASVSCSTWHCWRAPKVEIGRKQLLEAAC